MDTSTGGGCPVESCTCGRALCVVAELESQALEQNAESQYLFGKILMTGAFGVPVDVDRAIALFIAAEAGGITEATEELAPFREVDRPVAPLKTATPAPSEEQQVEWVMGVIRSIGEVGEDQRHLSKRVQAVRAALEQIDDEIASKEGERTLMQMRRDLERQAHDDQYSHYMARLSYTPIESLPTPPQYAEDSRLIAQIAESWAELLDLQNQRSSLSAELRRLEELLR
jgi:hypothetical protein